MPQPSRALFALVVAGVLFVGAASVLVGGDSQSVPAPKIAVPDAVAQRRASQELNSIYGDDIAKAKRPEAKAALAKKLLQAATETKDDPAAKYVILSTARDLAVGGDNADVTFDILSELAQYQIDGLKMETDVLAGMSRVTRGSQDALSLANRANSLVDEAISADRYALATQLAELAASWAKMAKNPDAIGQAGRRLDDVREIDSAFARSQKATATLSKTPNDPEASLSLGRFLAFQKGRWDAGLPMLAAGSDPDIKALAGSELANPAGKEKQVELADRWWAAAGKEKGLAQRQIRRHAARWYESALPNLTGLAKAKAEKRLNEIQSAPSASNAEWVDLLKLVKPERDAAAGKWAFEGAALQISRGAAPSRMAIAVEPGKNYELQVEFQRPAGGDALGVYLPLGDNGVVLLVRPKQIGLDTVDGKRFDQNDTTKTGEFGDSKKHLLDMSVSCDGKDGRIVVLFDGKPQIDWNGPTSKLAVNEGWAFPGATALGLGSWDTSFTVSAARLKRK
ncbi:MAG TPA: hypothetical protein VG269_25715 [Tepidisphaeraceae bacterium]|jgi:hypothetical protein|nr:hypothetical protein [Tepidisphaeraceae bacterium]